MGAVGSRSNHPYHHLILLSHYYNWLYACFPLLPFISCLSPHSLPSVFIGLYADHACFHHHVSTAITTTHMLLPPHNIPPGSTRTANAKDRMGHQIHQMYTARRIQRYEQLYGWRPLKFRIEAFVNGFVDLVCIVSFRLTRHTSPFVRAAPGYQLRTNP
jgi:hypothetical protein